MANSCKFGNDAIQEVYDRFELFRKNKAFDPTDPNVPLEQYSFIDSDTKRFAVKINGDYMVEYFNKNDGQEIQTQKGQYDVKDSVTLNYERDENGEFKFDDWSNGKKFRSTLRRIDADLPDDFEEDYKKVLVDLNAMRKKMFAFQKSLSEEEIKRVQLFEFNKFTEGGFYAQYIENDTGSLSVSKQDDSNNISGRFSRTNINETLVLTLLSVIVMANSSKFGNDVIQEVYDRFELFRENKAFDPTDPNVPLEQYLFFDNDTKRLAVKINGDYMVECFNKNGEEIVTQDGQYNVQDGVTLNYKRDENGEFEFDDWASGKKFKSTLRRIDADLPDDFEEDYKKVLVGLNAMRKKMFDFQKSLSEEDKTRVKLFEFEKFTEGGFYAQYIESDTGNLFISKPNDSNNISGRFSCDGWDQKYNVVDGKVVVDGEPFEVYDRFELFRENKAFDPTDPNVPLEQYLFFDNNDNDTKQLASMSNSVKINGDYMVEYFKKNGEEIVTQHGQYNVKDGVTLNYERDDNGEFKFDDWSNGKKFKSTLRRIDADLPDDFEEDYKKVLVDLNAMRKKMFDFQTRLSEEDRRRVQLFDYSKFTEGGFYAQYIESDTGSLSVSQPDSSNNIYGRFSCDGWDQKYNIADGKVVVDGEPFPPFFD
ncbi:hypothetical protein Bhyg_06521, partial [Pseudolycoriella hygida]